MLKVVSTLFAATLLNAIPAVAADAKQELQQKLESMQSLQANFSQQVTADNGDVLQQLTGELTIQRPNKMRWKTNPPDDTLMIASGDTVWYYNPFVEQVTIYQQQDATANSPMLLLLTGSDEQWQGYQVTESAPNEYHIVSDTAESELNLGFTNDMLTDIELQQQGGDTITLELTDVAVNPSLERQLFTFDVPDGVDVDDQR
ncbi:outer membrane lipoprotein carrier protein [Idiomarina aquatica]|uniref:Outer-membrane lipoprotein carrier protein n=1 Tax=Idiomarina aquatica TaxID=1327752 RepID=A0A4R6PPI0_9GAMM|nr:outer membrane lipoprotein chaperone LolA [Idiomarina aquatica]MAK70700.1 outer membrane lipoprotein carrier protein LolA [Idiomarinaceae bacterium]TDP40629.1 outer membrane lipoprotein carrier protein [Idiomarina aquatica]HAD48506.1 outer membrane lipoprotein carrier protein LolA [Idiomarina sp.]